MCGRVKWESIDVSSEDLEDVNEITCLRKVLENDLMVQSGIRKTESNRVIL